ncbi:SCO2524 family protein [Nocardia sp. NPDC004068]|uniref:SCO2524 family protein n=1 Tax=Nocardia sp. NPDC004068 TaxID=3364303 RepID=UPI00368FFC74
MRIRPRQQLLDLWRAVLDYSYVGGEWHWGGRDGSNSISDAEQLLCLLYPATEIDAFALDRPDDIATDVEQALAPFGERTRIGGMLVGLLEDYVARYTEADGEPDFGAHGYLRADDDAVLTDRQYDIEIVDAYSMSLSLCISALRFLRGFRRFVSGEVRREAKQLEPRIDAVEEGIRVRLTAAMTGLVRSFVIHTPDPKSDAGQNILGMINQSDAADEELTAALSRRLERLRVQAANEVQLGKTAEADVADDLRLFECGWSWGIFDRAEPIENVGNHVGDALGHAASRPYLYFTTVALDGIRDLSSQRIRELDLLDETQRTLADALQLRLELTERYWSTIARFGTGRWPLEDIPWRTSDGDESEYFSLAVAAMLIQDLVVRESTDDLARTVAVFDQLARRARVISRLTGQDAAARLHHPGVRIRLAGSEAITGGPRIIWYVPDFVTMMLKRTIQAAQLRTTVATRDQLMALAESAMEHLDKRMLRHGPAAGLWDDTSGVLGEAGFARELPSWFMTERVMECLVLAYASFREPPLAPQTMMQRAVELLSEAEHLHNQERLLISDDYLSPKWTALNRIAQSLDRARSQLSERPGTAFSLATRALTDLDELAYARQDARRGRSI